MSEWLIDLFHQKGIKMTESEKYQIKDRLLDVIEKLHGARDLIEMDDTELARVQLMDIVGQVQRLTLKLVK